jgi:hypothetical protein
MGRLLISNIPNSRKVKAYLIDYGYLGRLNIKRKITKESTAHERLRYKKYALFDFLDDINRHLMSENSVDIIKEVFIKELKVIENQKEENENETKSKQSKSKKSKKKTNKSQSKAEKADPETRIYYGLYNSEINISRFHNIFRNEIEKKNDLKYRDDSIVETKPDKSEKYKTQDRQPNDEAEPLASKEPQEKKNSMESTNNKLSQLQNNLAIHETHFQYLVRKILFEKFQKMKIWCRQAYSQDNSKIFIHLKIQGRL